MLAQVAKKTEVKIYLSFSFMPHRPAGIMGELLHLFMLKSLTGVVGLATQGTLGFVALMRKVKTQQVWPSAFFLLLFSPCPLSPYLSGHKTDMGAPGP